MKRKDVKLKDFIKCSKCNVETHLESYDDKKVIRTCPKCERIFIIKSPMLYASTKEVK